MVCPMKVARNAPAIPSTVVKRKPFGSFAPGETVTLGGYAFRFEGVTVPLETLASRERVERTLRTLRAEAPPRPDGSRARSRA